MFWGILRPEVWDPNMKFKTEHLSMNVVLCLKFKFKGRLKTVVDDWSSLKAWKRSLKLDWKSKAKFGSSLKS